MSLYDDTAGSKADQAAEVASQGPLQPLIEIVPENVIKAAADNSSMLQVVFFAIIVGIALLQIPKEKAKNFTSFFDAFNDVIINELRALGDANDLLRSQAAAAAVGREGAPGLSAGLAVGAGWSLGLAEVDVHPPAPPR